jgi:PAS domain S-box-containing protein
VVRDRSRPAEEALRHSELRFRALIECLPQRVFFKDRDSVFLFVNSTFAGDFGLKPEQLVGKSDLDFFPKELAEKYRADDRRIMEARRAETIEEMNVVGEMARYVEVVKAPVVDDNGEVNGLLGVFTDITDRKMAEGTLKDFAARLERSNRELQDFAYVASHDLQEPLRKVSVFGERLKTKCGEALGDEGRDFLDRMQKATGRMQGLINDLLNFSRVTTKSQPFGTVNLHEVVREVVTDLETRIEQTGGRVEVGQLPTIEAEPLHMRQLLQNLIGNALKFRRPDVPPVIRVAAEFCKAPPAPGSRSNAPREMVRLTVSDNGIGFDEKYTERIFQVFQRLHSRAEYEGTGMGLAITRKIVEHHEGEVTAKSKLGEGSTFIVTLPVKQRKADERL